MRVNKEEKEEEDIYIIKDGKEYLTNTLWPGTRCNESIFNAVKKKKRISHLMTDCRSELATVSLLKTKPHRLL